MTHLKSSSDQSSNGLVQIIRIEKILYQELMSCSGFSGRIGQIYQNGFDLIREDGRLIYFQRGKWLHSPFGVILDCILGKWVEDIPLKEGDVFYQKGQCLIRKSRNRCFIRLNPTYIIDLKRKLYFSPPECETLLSWIQLLTEEIFNWGRFEGIAGTLTLLKKELPDIFSIRSFPISIWSRHALPWVMKLKQSIIDEDSHVFEDAWGALLGLGPGLTPAGDDFLVGFLAAHKLLSSSFGRRLEDYDIKRKLKEKARFKTGQISYQFLTYALEGIFSETLYLVFDDLTSHGMLKEKKDCLYSEKEGAEKIQYFLKWGHSSGTDTLTGTVFGLWMMISPKCSSLKQNLEIAK